MADLITYETTGPVGVICFNRPDKRNAFTLEMFRLLTEKLGQADDDNDIRAVVLHAAGQDMTTGLDLMDVGPAFMKGERPFGEDATDPWGVVGRPRRKPMVVVTHGRSYTLGFEAALASEACVAAEDSVFALLEVKVGIYPIGGGIERLILATGWSTAMRYILTGDEIPAAEAHRLGLVAELAPDKDAALARGMEIANAMAAANPAAVQAALAHARKAIDSHWKDTWAEMPGDIQRLMSSLMGG